MIQQYIWTTCFSGKLRKLIFVQLTTFFVSLNSRQHVRNQGDNEFNAVSLTFVSSDTRTQEPVQNDIAKLEPCGPLNCSRTWQTVRTNSSFWLLEFHYLIYFIFLSETLEKGSQCINPNQSLIFSRAKCSYSTKISSLYFKNYIPMTLTWILKYYSESSLYY